MNTPQLFSFEDHIIRIVDQDQETWFVGKDVCKALNISKYRDALATLDSDETCPVILDTNAGKREMACISEPGVFRLIFRSRKPEAERFKRWLAHEVLPQIRRTGRYIPSEEYSRQSETFYFEGEPLTTLQARLSIIREGRLIFGAAHARTLWKELGLPAPDRKSVV